MKVTNIKRRYRVDLGLDETLQVYESADDNNLTYVDFTDESDEGCEVGSVCLDVQGVLALHTILGEIIKAKGFDDPAYDY